LVPILDVLYISFSLNKWQYRDEYIVIVVLRKKIGKNSIKKLQKSGMSCIQTSDCQLAYNAGHAHH